LEANTKVWVGQVASNTSGNFTFDISSAGFSTILSAVATPVNNTTTATAGDFLWIRAITTTTVTGTIAHGTSLLALGATTVAETTARTISLIVYGI
jgi:hypothetical protein